MQPSSSQQPTTDAIDYDRELTRLQSQYNQSDGISVLPEMMRLLLSAGSEASSITSKLHKLHRCSIRDVASSMASSMHNVASIDQYNILYRRLLFLDGIMHKVFSTMCQVLEGCDSLPRFEQFARAVYPSITNYQASIDPCYSLRNDIFPKLTDMMKRKLYSIMERMLEDIKEGRGATTEQLLPPNLRSFLVDAPKSYWLGTPKTSALRGGGKWQPSSEQPRRFVH